MRQPYEAVASRGAASRRSTDAIELLSTLFFRFSVGRLTKGDLHQDGAHTLPEGDASAGGDLGPNPAGPTEHHSVRHATGVGGILHRGRVHEVRTRTTLKKGKRRAVNKFDIQPKTR